MNIKKDKVIHSLSITLLITLFLKYLCGYFCEFVDNFKNEKSTFKMDFYCVFNINYTKYSSKKRSYTQIINIMWINDYLSKYVDIYVYK